MAIIPISLTQAESDALDTWIAAHENDNALKFNDTPWLKDSNASNDMASTMRIVSITKFKQAFPGVNNPSAQQLAKVAADTEVEMRIMLEANNALKQLRTSANTDDGQDSSANGSAESSSRSNDQGAATNTGSSLPSHASNFNAVAQSINANISSLDNTPNPDDCFIEPTRALTNLIVIPTPLKNHLEFRLPIRLRAFQTTFLRRIMSGEFKLSEPGRLSMKQKPSKPGSKDKAEFCTFSWLDKPSDRDELMDRSDAESAFVNIIRAYTELKYPNIAAMLREFFDYITSHEGWHSTIGCRALLRISSDLLQWEALQSERVRLTGEMIEKRFSLAVANIGEEDRIAALESMRNSESGRGSTFLPGGNTGDRVARGPPTRRYEPYPSQPKPPSSRQDRGPPQNGPQRSFRCILCGDSTHIAKHHPVERKTVCTFRDGALIEEKTGNLLCFAWNLGRFCNQQSNPEHIATRHRCAICLTGHHSSDAHP